MDRKLLKHQSSRNFFVYLENKIRKTDGREYF